MLITAARFILPATFKRLNVFFEAFIMRLKPEHNDDFLSIWRNPVRVFLALHAKCIYAAVLPWDFFFLAIYQHI